MTGYYLEKAAENKQNLESNDFTAAQLNTLLSMMRQCWKLRQSKIINNLVEASLPDNFEIQENLKKGRDGEEYKTFTVVEKVAA